MKSLSLCLVLLCSTLLAQNTIDFAPDNTVPAPAQLAAQVAKGGVDGVVSYKEQVIGQVRLAIEADDKVGPIRKRIRLRLIENQEVQSKILEMVTPKALDSGAVRIVVGENFDETQPVKLDIDKLLELFKQLMPFLLMLLDLFG